MRTVRSVLGNERGSVVVMLRRVPHGDAGLAALAIDLAALRDARGEAQRAADAIALAGATAFRDKAFTDPTATTDALAPRHGGREAQQGRDWIRWTSGARTGANDHEVVG